MTWQTKNQVLFIGYGSPCLMHNSMDPFYLTQGFWTFIAVVVALATPWIVKWLNERPKKSSLVFKNTSIIRQLSNNCGSARNLLNVGRIILTNEGKYKAKLVEVYIEEIISNNKKRENFFPIPLKWTHGELNQKGITVRDIYKNQTVYLDIFNYVYNGIYNNCSIELAVATGLEYDDFSKIYKGESRILIKLYQESGQVNEVWLKLSWDGDSVPQLYII